MMLDVKRKALLKRLNYQFSDLRLFEQALTHRSAHSQNNERLEYLGDAILNFVIADALYQRFPEVKEGKLSRLRAILVKTVTLAEIGRELMLGDVLILGPGELKNGGFRRESILADTVEAIIGAIYLDGDMCQVKAMILRLFEERLDAIDAKQVVKDAKTRLQELLQSQKQPLPLYSVKEIKSAVSNTPLFEASCQISLLDKLVIAQGSSHRKAEQKSAERALQLLAQPQ